MSAGDAGKPGASASSAFSSVVLPAPLRPTSTIFSPRLTMALKSGDDRACRRSALVTPSNSSAMRPDGRFIVNLMYGRWMFDRASSVVCSRSTSLRRDCTWLERVPAEKRAMKSFSCAIFFSRCAFSDSMRERICVLASTMSS